MHLPTLRYRKYNPDGVMTHRVVWWRWVGAVPVCPPVSPHKGASIVKSSCVNGCGGNQACRACTFDSPGLPTIGGYPGESRGGEPMPSALYLLKSICVWETICSPRVVMMCDEKKYTPQGGSLLPYIITQGRLRCTCQPCAIESITATR